MAHTPKEWKVSSWDDKPCVKYPVEDLDGWQHWVPQNEYYLDGSALDDARFIVQACNSHEALLEACKAAFAFVEMHAEREEEPGPVAELRDLLRVTIVNAEEG